MKNKNGFTLVELLAVIVILGLLSSIAVIAVLKVKKVQDGKNNANMVAGILTGAKRYATDNPNANWSDGVDLSELVDGNYTDADYTKISPDTKIHVTEGSNVCSNSFKRAFYITVNGNPYNDCGCVNQPVSSTDFKTLCSGENGETSVDSIQISN